MKEDKKIKKEVKEENSADLEVNNETAEILDKKDIAKNEINKSKNTFKEENDEDKSDLENELPSKEFLDEQIIQLRDEKLRLLAEMENLRKRSDRDRIDSIRYGSINFIRDILSPDDNLTRALEAIPSEIEKTPTVVNLVDGLKMIQKEFSSILEKHGVQKIVALNKKFDHNFHQAMVEIENDEVEEGTIITEMQSGYTMYDRLLRPSMVGVAKKSNKDNKDSEKNQ